MSYKYGGRRSKGCNLCRKRKVRCGEEKPGCSRCQKLGSECVYREEVDLLFHDETAHVSARAERMWLSRAIEDKSDEPTDCYNLSSSGNSSRDASPPQGLVLTRALSQPLAEIAFSRFMHDFVMERRTRLSRIGYLEYLPRLYRSSGPDASITPVIEAVALANFSRRCHAPAHVAAAASARYSAALYLTSEALKNPVRMLKHETVLSCYLLGMYELIVPSASTFTAWNAHSQGAMTLLQLRGLRQLEDPVGLAMFRQIYASELVSALRYCHKPKDFPELTNLVADPAQLMVFNAISDTSRTAAEFLSIANGANGVYTTEEGAALCNLLKRAQELEDRVKLIASDLPHWFTFEWSKRDQTLGSAPRWLQRVFRDRRAPDRCHKNYLHITIANAANWTRHCHIRALELQVLISVRLGKAWQPLETKLKEIESIVDDLNATIVYYLTCDEDGEFNTSDEVEDVRGVKCFFLLRVLAAAKMALEFVSRRGLDVSEKLGWLGELCEFLRTEIGYEVPEGRDPLDLHRG